jgi:hypothetical protein
MLFGVAGLAVGLYLGVVGTVWSGVVTCPPGKAVHYHCEDNQVVIDCVDNSGKPL